jgi:Ca2+-binding EF-hand superfamily protein
MMRTVLILVAGCFCAGGVFAQGREQAGAMFEHADANDDGALSREEFVYARTDQFEKRDRNGDAFIDNTDLSERAAARPRVSQAMNAIVQQFDADHDGKLSKDEFVAGGMKVFERADVDHDGSLDTKELAAAKSAVKAGADSRLNPDVSR